MIHSLHSVTAYAGFRTIENKALVKNQFCVNTLVEWAVVWDCGPYLWSAMYRIDLSARKMFNINFILLRLLHVRQRLVSESNVWVRLPTTIPDFLQAYQLLVNLPFLFGWPPYWFSQRTARILKVLPHVIAVSCNTKRWTKLQFSRLSRMWFHAETQS